MRTLKAPLQRAIERVRHLTLIEVLLIAILLCGWSAESKLDDIDKRLQTVDDSLVDVQNKVSDESSDIQSKLDDIKEALDQIAANQ
jgi:hypothetical protein